MKKSENSVKFGDIVEQYNPPFYVIESDIILINKIIDNKEIDCNGNFKCPSESSPPDGSLLNNCTLCALLFPKISNKVNGCPCNYYTQKEIIKTVKDFSKKFYNKLSEINYKAFEVETSDFTVLDNEFTAFRIIHQDNIVNDYLHTFLKYYLNTIKFISENEPDIYNSQLDGRLLFCVRGKYIDKDNKIVFVEKKFKDRILKSIELLNKDIYEYKKNRKRKK